ncbi:MAG: hypothetical protein AAGC68_01145 [Verrucomicrobiota bacterium]
MRAVSFFVGAAILAASSISLVAGDFPREEFFVKLEGGWEGSGSLVNSDGEETAIAEEWTGRFCDDGSFAMEGTRQWGEDQQEFRWVYRFNPTTELFECDYWHTGMDQDVRFEVSLAGERIEMMAPIGDPGTELRIINAFSREGLEGSISMTSAQGGELLSGTVSHSRKD